MLNSFKVRPSSLWTITALLLGVSVFGITKSFDLIKKNNVLDRSVSELKLELAETSAMLKETNVSLEEIRSSLRKSYLKDAQTQGQIKVLELKLAKSEEEIKSYTKNLEVFSEKLQEATEINKSLVAQNRQMADNLLRSEFEKKEMALKLSSISELKKCIKQVKRRMRVTGRRDLLTQRREARMLGSSGCLRVNDSLLDGNRGFVLKDGQSTLREVVDIKVLAVEPAERQE